MSKKRLVTKEQIEEKFTYLPQEGRFLRKHSYRKYLAGTYAEVFNSDGAYLKFGQSKFSRKHLVWTMETGKYPTTMLIHLDGDCYNDQIDNLAMLPKTQNEITRKLLENFFTYDQTSGRLSRSVGYSNTKESLSGTLNTDGYYEFKVGNLRLKAHRIIWFMVYGEWPEQIDHINGVRTDNRLKNLREVSSLDNSKNRARLKSATGETGVGFTGSLKNPYISRIVDMGKIIHLGVFKTLEEAVAARKTAEEKYGYHLNHGKPAEVRAEYSEEK